MATRNQLRDKIQEQTVGRFCAKIDELWRENEIWFGSAVRLPDSPLSQRFFWNAAGTCRLNLPEANIDMTAPIGHVLRWHLDNHR